MDNLTHSLTGVLLSRAGLNRFTPRATAILVLSSNAPDVDAISVLGGADSYFHYHRGLTHSLVMIPVLAALVALGIKLVFRKSDVRVWPAFGLALIGLGGHVLLDFTNQYGIRLFLPFSEAWPGLNITNVVDIWIWLVVIVASVWPLLSRLVSSEIGAKKTGGRGLAITALVLFALYDCGRAVLHQRAIAEQAAWLYDGEMPRRIGAYPTSLDPFLWRGVVETDSAYHIFTFRLTREFDPAGGRKYLKPEDSAQIQAARRVGPMARLLSFSPLVLLRATPAAEIENGTKVEGTDLRFSSPARGGFTATVLLDGDGQEKRAWFRY